MKVFIIWMYWWFFLYNFSYEREKYLKKIIYFRYIRISKYWWALYKRWSQKRKFKKDYYSWSEQEKIGFLSKKIREKNFIKWDWDIELAVFSEEVINKCNEICNYAKDLNFKAEIIDESLDNLKINLYKNENNIY